jgi:hypothetical protein
MLPRATARDEGIANWGGQQLHFLQLKSERVFNRLGTADGSRTIAICGSTRFGIGRLRPFVGAITPFKIHLFAHVPSVQRASPHKPESRIPLLISLR